MNFKNAGFGHLEIVHYKKNFLTTTRNKFAGKFVKRVRFLAVLREHIFCNVDWVEVCQMSEVFLMKLYCKRRNFLCQFFFTLVLSARQSEIKNWIPNMRFWMIYFLAQISFYWTVLNILANVIFFFFLLWANHAGKNFYSDAPVNPSSFPDSPPTRHKTLSHSLVVKH